MAAAFLQEHQKQRNREPSVVSAAAGAEAHEWMVLVRPTQEGEAAAQAVQGLQDQISMT
jgi:hypothetical protein